MARILLCHNNYTITGGAEVFYHEVGRVLAENGHDVAFFSCYEEGLESPWSDYFPRVPNYKKSPLSSIVKFNCILYSRTSIESIDRLICDFKPDIAHCFAIYSKLTPSILDSLSSYNIPIVCSFNDYKHICPNYKLFHHGRLCEECIGGKYYRAIVNRCCHNSLMYSVANSLEAYLHSWLDIYKKNVNTFLFASDFMARKTEQFWGRGTFVWRKLRNPFDSTKFEAVYCPEGPVLFFGRLIDEKGVDVLIEAASVLPDVSFRIVGDGPEMATLRKKAEPLNNVVFVGPKWGAEMDLELKQCRFVVVPSLWHENFPYVINQSFAFGKPVVGSDRGGIPELVDDGTRGLVYEADNPAALAVAVKNLWFDAEMVQKMGVAAKTYADSEFNDRKFYQTLQSIYGEVLE
ncbi:glycosyltransferase family 1 protein [Geothermobacter hydrogeniphilus]|uniref:Glycosyltransferase family 1 protein n=1 Tax=Geothermobacter hydrogeniphilus TaxID=1969733 RepID=A0A2K2HAG2_9BACT|nr:glycosyltransferase family 4 protein [Geothermobacter hydrogeniphilus]PNU20296.1 glycosyltransferase family 1 protein [Geothermobacter hydrogeniphilus]